MDKRFETMSADELKAELARLKECLCDVEEMHAFTFGRTSVHISAETAQSMQDQHEQECRLHREQIARIESLLGSPGAAQHEEA